jgi:hypothetical protein
MKDFIKSYLLLGLVVVIFVGLWIIGFLSMIGSPIADNFWDSFKDTVDSFSRFTLLYITIPTGIGASLFWAVNQFRPSKKCKDFSILIGGIFLVSLVVLMFLSPGNPEYFGLRP